MRAFASRSLLRRGQLLLLAIVVAACGHVVAQAPPATPPVDSDITTIAGAPVVIAARGARVIADYGFTTRRFSADSLWAWRGVDKIAARMRYGRAGDSTRVFMELWGPCGRRGCMRGDMKAIFARMGQEDAPPQ